MYTRLISAQALQAMIGQPKLLMIDVSHNLADPNEGARHFCSRRIPGAVFMDLNTQLSAPVTGKNGRHPLPDKLSFRKLLGQYGITPDTQVIVYDTQGMFSPRLWWMLNWVGHTQVAVLDGGLTAWIQAGLPLDTDTRLKAFDTSESNTALPYPERPSLYTTVNVIDVENNLAHPSFTLLDARAPGRYHGEGETMDPVGGHIPGAVNRFFQQNLQENGLFKSDSLLADEFKALCIQHDISPEDLVHQCGSGVTACHNIFAMAVAGFSPSRLYPGSWSEWCSEPSRPVAK